MKTKLAAVHGALAVFGIILLYSLFGLVRGSSEMFPTAEQHEKARIFHLVSIFLTGTAN